MVYKCVRCGKITQNPSGIFSRIPSEERFKGNDGYNDLCSQCSDLMFRTYVARYKDEKLAMIMICAANDLYFAENLYNTLRDSNSVSYGNYKKALNFPAYRNKTFNTFLQEMMARQSLTQDVEVLREDRETRWKMADKKNKRYVLETIGYDCFDDDSYTDIQRKFLFNTLADYLTDDVIEDPHKVQSVISLVKTMLQKESVDVMINAELRKVAPDYSMIKQLADVKDKLAKDLNTTAKDNGISAVTSGKSGKSSSTLTGIMKEMGENGFEEIKVNLMEAKLSESYTEVAEKNAHALIEELNLTGDDYARMVGEQSEMVRSLQDEKDKLQEELRLTKKALKEEQDKRKRGAS